MSGFSPSSFESSGVQVELASILNITADALLEVTQPVARDVDKGSYTAHCNSRRDQDPPDLARICEYSKLAKQTRRVGGQLSYPRALFAVFIDPIDGGKMVVAHSSARPFHVPIPGSRILGSLAIKASINRRIEVVQDGVGGRLQAEAGVAAWSR